MSKKTAARYIQIDGTTIQANGSDQLKAVSSSILLTRTSVNNAASPYSILTTDQILACQTSTGTITLTLPLTTGMSGKWYIFKDETGNAKANNFTVNTTGGASIDGSPTAVLKANYGSFSVYTDGTNWFIY